VPQNRDASHCDRAALNSLIDINVDRDYDRTEIELPGRIPRNPAP